MRDVGVLMGKMREIMWDVYRFIPGYNGVSTGLPKK